MLTESFSYELPDSLIANTPSENRAGSRLLHLDRNTRCITHRKFNAIPELLNAGDVLVLNDTKVINARLTATKPSGGKVEIFLNRQVGNNQWEALIKPAKRVQVGTVLHIGTDFTAKVRQKNPESGIHTLTFNSPNPILDAIDTHGEIPLPPYIAKDPSFENYKDRYQTVFASTPGAVAAPTAGLHFTTELLNQLREKGVTIETITLHVGYGTFQPIKTDHITDHKIHRESYCITGQTADRLTQLKKSKRLIAVGTTVARTLESAFNGHYFQSGDQETDLFIYPGYKFTAVDALITNFHLPKSSLLCLVSAFASQDMINTAYKDAIKREYKFYSFGDAMLIT